jgi:sigma-E factor negative regulatory protein RseC
MQETDVDTEEGIVVELKAQDIVVECSPHDMCASCSAKKGCIMSESGKVRYITMANSIGAVKGDRVLFAVESSGIVAASLVIYLIPVVFLFTGLYTGYRFNEYLMLDKDSASAILGVLFFILSFFVIKFFSGITKNSSIFQPRAVKIIKRGQ